MRKRTLSTEIVKNTHSTEIIMECTYEVNKRIEECHGLHQFDDYDLIHSKLMSVVINFGEFDIDITDRLTQKEIDYITSI